MAARVTQWGVIKLLNRKPVGVVGPFVVQQDADIYGTTHFQATGFLVVPLYTEKFQCPHCQRDKPGRWRRPQENPHRSGRGWDQGSQHVQWICHDCDAAQGTAPTKET
jgi:hypothetical protein